MQKAERPFPFQNTFAPLDHKSGNIVTLDHLPVSGENQNLKEVPEAIYCPNYSFTSMWQAQGSRCSPVTLGGHVTEVLVSEYLQCKHQGALQVLTSLGKGFFTLLMDVDQGLLHAIPTTNREQGLRSSQAEDLCDGKSWRMGTLFGFLV